MATSTHNDAQRRLQPAREPPLCARFVDLHIHVLPGLDDGARDLDEALAMCRMAAADGARDLVATAHMLDGVFDVDCDRVRRGVETLQRHVDREVPGLRLAPGGDVRIHPDLPRLLRDGRALTVADRGRHVIVELPEHVLPERLARLIFELQLDGVTLVISHPERNRAVQRDPVCLHDAVAAGALVQVTAGSLTGAFGAPARRCGETLLRQRLAHVVASDAHAASGRRPGLSAARDAAAILLPRAEVDEMFHIRPAQMFAGETVNVPEPASCRGTRRWFSWGRREQC